MITPFDIITSVDEGEVKRVPYTASRSRLYIAKARIAVRETYSQRVAAFTCPNCKREVRVTAKFYETFRFVTCRKCRTLWSNAAHYSISSEEDVGPHIYDAEVGDSKILGLFTTSLDGVGRLND